GLVGFVAGLARQTAARNVTINNLLPGIFDSDAQRAHVRAMLEASGKTFEKLWRARAEANPARRYGRPDELGAYCAFLCLQHAGFITGQNSVDGGGGLPGTNRNRRCKGSSHETSDYVRACDRTRRIVAGRRDGAELSLPHGHGGGAVSGRRIG